MFNSDILKNLINEEETTVLAAISANRKEFPERVEDVREVRQRLKEHLTFLLEYEPEDDSVDYGEY